MGRFCETRSRSRVSSVFRVGHDDRERFWKEPRSPRAFEFSGSSLASTRVSTTLYENSPRKCFNRYWTLERAEPIARSKTRNVTKKCTKKDAGRDDLSCASACATKERRVCTRVSVTARQRTLSRLSSRRGELRRRRETCTEDTAASQRRPAMVRSLEPCDHRTPSAAAVKTPSHFLTQFWTTHAVSSVSAHARFFESPYREAKAANHATSITVLTPQSHRTSFITRFTPHKWTVGRGKRYGKQAPCHSPTSIASSRILLCFPDLSFEASCRPRFH